MVIFLLNLFIISNILIKNLFLKLLCMFNGSFFNQKNDPQLKQSCGSFFFII
jgi:hypothetical protein